MHNKLKLSKLLPVILTCILAISLAACGTGSNAANSNTASSNATGSNSQGGNNSTGTEGSSTASGSKSTASESTSGSTSDDKIDTSKFETITYVVLGTKPPDTAMYNKVMDQINAIMKKKINAQLEFKWIDWTDYLDKYNLLLASGQPIDLVTIATDWLDTWPNVEKGAFLPLDKLLPKYAPQTWNEIPPEDWAQTKYKNQIYMIPEDHFTQWVNHGFYYRGDWAKQCGITQPIRDFQTMGKYFQCIKDTKKDVIPYDVDGSSNEILHGYINSTTKALDLAIPTGFAPVYYAKSYDEKYTAYSPIFTDTFVNFAKLMKKWADAGYWRTDVLNYKGGTGTELLGGLTAADEHHTQDFSTTRVKMDQKQPGSDLQMFPFAYPSDNLIKMSITHGGTSVGAHSKHPERALMAYELIRQNKQVYDLVNYGIEGIQYVIKDGVMSKPPGYNEATDQFYSDFWGGRVDKFNLPTTDVWPGVEDYYKEYDKIAKPFPYGQFVFDKQPVQAELSAISNVTSQLVPAIAFGKAGDPVKAVDNLRAKLKAAGYDKVLQEVQKQLTAYKQMIESEQ